MSYGYGQGGTYGGGRNPYDQREEQEDTGYHGYNNSGYGRLQDDVEMQPFTNNASDPNEILNECRTIDQALDDLENQLGELQRLFRNPDQDRSISNRIASKSEDVMNTYRGIGTKIKKVKSRPGAGNARNSPQVGKVDRRLKKLINQYQTLERDWRNDQQARREREYRIVKPDATEEEVRAAAADPNAQIYQQALMNSNRLGQATTTLQEVRARHENIQKIERDMVELAQLFQDLNAVVVQQEETIVEVEKQAEDVNDNMVKANTEIDHAITSARARNRKKWWCLLICVIIIIIIVVAILAYGASAGWFKKN